MRILIITTILMLTLGSCQIDNKAKFEITNTTENPIDSINIKSYDHEINPNYLKLESGESRIYWFNMNNIPTVDGDYLLRFKRMTNKIESERFGYFTNGYPLEEITKIEILKDTVIIDQIFD
jgi:hypothetical protein